MHPGMSPPDALLAVLREWFPQWEVWRERGVWHAAGFMVISASTAESLLEHLAGADPDAFARVAEKLTEAEAEATS